MKTRKIKIVFYKNSKTFFGRIIRVQQFLQEFFYSRKHNKKMSDDWRYSHAEVVFCGLTFDDRKKLDNTQIQGRWGEFNRIHNFIFFSSSEIDGGVRFKNIIPKKNHWDFVEISVTEEQYSRMLDRAISTNGQNYSKWGILFAQAFSLNFSKEDEKFCSQTVSILLGEAFGTDFSKVFFEKYTHFINPLKLARRLKKFLSINK